MIRHAELYIHLSSDRVRRLVDVNVNVAEKSYEVASELRESEPWHGDAIRIETVELLPPPPPPLQELQVHHCHINAVHDTMPLLKPQLYWRSVASVSPSVRTARCFSSSLPTRSTKTAPVSDAETMTKDETFKSAEEKANSMVAQDQSPPSTVETYHPNNQPDYSARTDHGTSLFSPVPRRVMDGSEPGETLPAAVLSGAPIDLQARVVRYECSFLSSVARF